MIDLRRRGQLTFGEGLIAEETIGLWESWMRHDSRRILISEDKDFGWLVFAAN